MEAEVFEMLVADVQQLLRHFGGRKEQPTAVAIDSRALQSTPESGGRAAYAGDCPQVAALGNPPGQRDNTVELAYVDQGYMGEATAEAAQKHGIRLEVVKHPMAKRGFALLPRRWVVERRFA